MDTLQACQTMLCNRIYLADILRVCEIKDLISGDAFSKSLSLFILFFVINCHFVTVSDSSVT